MQPSADNSSSSSNSNSNSNSAHTGAAPKFVGSDPGTPAAAWAADERFATLPTLTLEGVTGVIVIAPHPDDESLGAGGLIAECAARGLPVRVIMVTDGEAAAPEAEALARGAAVSSARREAVYSARRELGERRRREATVAVALLDSTAVVEFLSIPDGDVLNHQTALQSQLDRIFATVDASTLVVAPWQGDGHRDHRVVGLCARAAADNAGLRIVFYPVWLWHWGSPAHALTPWNDFVRLPLSAHARAAKLRAIAAHGSQTAPLDGAAVSVLHPHFLLNFDRSDEVFVSTVNHDSRPRTLGADYFDRTYARHDDPWGFQTRWYEARKRAITVASLPRERYARGFEIGCSIGILSEALAPRVDDLLSVDVSPAAVQTATERLRPHNNVAVEVRDVVSDYPAGRFDLVVLSEVGYYLGADDLAQLLGRIAASLTPAATFILCHWRHPVVDYPQSGDEVHAAARSLAGLSLIASHTETDFLLDVFSPDSRSVAQLTGLAE